MSTNTSIDVQVQAGPCVWTPPPTVTDHLGGKLPADLDFFVVPPGEIGEIKSAYTSLKRGAQARSVAVRIAITAAYFVAGFALGGVLYLVSHNLFFILFVGIPIGSLVAVGGWRKAGFPHSCAFVGPEGCAHFESRDTRENLTERGLLRFRDAGNVQTSSTRHIKNGVYQHTTFRHCWNLLGGGHFIIDGVHSSNTKTPPVESLYHYAHAAETAWINYLIPKLDDELNQKGYINFYLADGRTARVGRGFLEIVDKDGNVSRSEAGDIGSAQLASGTFTLTRKDATSKFFGLLGSSGVFRFDYSNMGNARLFLYAFEKLLNIPVVSL